MRRKKKRRISKEKRENLLCVCVVVVVVVCEAGAAAWCVCAGREVSFFCCIYINLSSLPSKDVLKLFPLIH